MSQSHYRGKLHTNDELKGPFTEAHDEFDTAYELLYDAVADHKTLAALIKAGAAVHLSKDTLFLGFGGIWVQIGRDGKFEVGEGAA